MRKIAQTIGTTIVKIILIICCLVLIACAPTVKVESPQEPITINLNIKLDADIRVKLEEQAKKDIAANPSIF
ncbi:MAG: YnbE family lipoprotein [Gammaproteobacteria bacterium]|nr:MAG: YnbE family lipoprotein [Gammaproteobacteria bacterium]